MGELMHAQKPIASNPTAFCDDSLTSEIPPHLPFSSSTNIDLFLFTSGNLLLFLCLYLPP